MTIEEYYDALACHDWYYNYSDDHGVWQKGLAESRRLQAVCQENDVFTDMYTDFVNWTNNPREIRKPQLQDYQPT